MSRDLYFHVEARTADGWRVPAVLPEASVDSSAGEFAWTDDFVRASELFLGERALFPFVTGPAEGSPLLAFIAREWGDTEGSWIETYRPSWISFPDLMVDSWDEPGAIRVGARVTRDVAPLFGAGEADLPADALKKRGWSEARIQSLVAEAGITDTPVNWDALASSTRADVPSHHLVHVTWRTSVDMLLGRGLASAFKALRRVGPDADLRVIAITR